MKMTKTYGDDRVFLFRCLLFLTVRKFCALVVGGTFESQGLYRNIHISLIIFGRFLLRQAGAEYNKKDYAFQSAGVVSTLQDLLKEFREERSKGQEEWKKTKQVPWGLGFVQMVWMVMDAPPKKPGPVFAMCLLFGTFGRNAIRNKGNTSNSKQSLHLCVDSLRQSIYATMDYGHYLKMGS